MRFVAASACAPTAKTTVSASRVVCSPPSTEHSTAAISAPAEPGAAPADAPALVRVRVRVRARVRVRLRLRRRLRPRRRVRVTVGVGVTAALR